VYDRHVNDESPESTLETAVEDADQPLIAAAQEGDAAAFAALVERHQEMAYRVAYLLLRDAHAAEDITQDAFLRAHRALDSFRLGERFRPWFLRIVSNLAKNELRARSRRARLRDRATRWLPVHHEDIERVVVDRDRWSAVRRLLDEAPEADREVLLLRHVADLSEAEMADVLDCAPGTVKSRLSRARARLRVTIQEHHAWLIPGGERDS
jgi:RNA polymerase sigma-70 factor (ECF subfamily)